MTLFIASATLR